MIPLRRFPAIVCAALTAALLLGGCATGLPSVTPAQIPNLQAQLDASPDDPELQTRLGVAYYRGERFDDAEETLAAALEDGAATGSVYLYLGLANEGQEDWTGAREAYAEYMDSGRYGPLREDIEARMAFIVQQELRAQAQTALEQEAQLSSEPPAPRTVAVFPFRLVSDDVQFEPLSVALADMMITDLSLAGGITVLERTMIQALLNEMALTEAGYTEPETGARAGRLLRSEHVVQGAVNVVGQERLQMATDIRNTVQGNTQGQVNGEEAVQDLFALEKQTVFEILDVLGVEITPAEREAINENRAENILAFLAYGRGLQAMDRGDYEQAMAEFQQSASLDPGFEMAQNQVEQAGRLQQGAELDRDQIDRQAVGETGGGAATAEGADMPSTSQGSTTSTVLEQTASQTNPNRGQNLTDQGSVSNGTDLQAEERNPTQEAQNSDQVTGRPVGTIDIVIRRPGSE